MPETYAIEKLHLEPSSEVLRLLGQCPEIAPIRFWDGELLVREAATSQEIFLVLKGSLVVEQASAVVGGAPVMLACITAEPDSLAIIGEMAYLGAQARAASVRSCGATHTLRLEPRHIDGILDGFPMLTRLICRQFSQRLQDTDHALRTLQSRFALSPGQRMAQQGEVLFAQGDPAQALFQLVAGGIRLDGPGGTRMVGPDDLPQGLLEPGPFLAGGAQTHTATVEGMAFLAVIDLAHREALVRCFPNLALDLLAQKMTP
jgi:CRP-like cAMP-binding protein